MSMIAEFLSENFYPYFKVINIFFTKQDKEICIAPETLATPSCPHCHSSDVVVHESPKRQV